MSELEPQPTVDTDVAVPADLDSARAKLVYLYLSLAGGATVENLCEALDLGTGTALTITNTLRQRGYVERRDDTFVVA